MFEWWSATRPALPTPLATSANRGLRAAAEAAAAAARRGGGGVRTIALSRVSAPAPNDVAVMPETVAKAEKVALLRRADEAARSAGGAIRQVTAVYGDSRRRILVANSEGVLASDDQVKTRFAVSCVASGDTGLQTGRESVGATVGFELFDSVRRRGPGPFRGLACTHQAGGPTRPIGERARGDQAGQWGSPFS